MISHEIFIDSGIAEYQKSRRRVLTRRGVLWLGQTCNLRCHFCYFLDRIAKKDHPEHPFMSLDKAKQICTTLVDHYANCAIDIQGGEPMIYPDIYELVRYCRDIGLIPTLITNAIVLDNYDKCQRLIDSGIRDLLISVHGIGETYSKIVGVPGAHARQMKALENLQKIGLPFRFNCVLSKEALPQIREISHLAINSGARVVNFIAFNPFEDQQNSDKRSSENVPRYSDIKPNLDAALDILDDAGIECNVRYIPFCIVSERHRKSIYNFQQLPYDTHEWDYASWSWTGLQPQRMRDGCPTPTVSLSDVTFDLTKYGLLSKSVVHFINGVTRATPDLRKYLLSVYHKLRVVVTPSKTLGIDELYRKNAQMRASVHCKYSYAPVCDNCSIKPICDGFHGDYTNLFGTTEASPIINGPRFSDPRHYIVQQDKIVEREDYEWSL